MPRKKTTSKSTDTTPQKSKESDSKTFIQTIKENRIKVAVILVIAALVFVFFYFRGLIMAATVNGSPIWRYKVVADADQIYGTEVLEPLIQQEIIKQEAEKLGITVSQEDLQKEFDSVKEQFEATGQDLDAALEQSGLTKEEAIESLRPRVYEKKLIEKQNIQISEEEIDEEIEKLYENSPDLDRPTTEEEIEGQRQQIRESLRSKIIQEYFQKLSNDANVDYFVDHYRRP